MKLFNIVCCLLFLLSNFSFAEDIYNEVANSKKWKALLHWNSKVKISKHFYLSYPNISLEDELRKTLKNFKSKNSKKAICTFPARYLFLKKFFRLPDINLGSCKSLNKFVRNFPKDKFGIVYSSEYMNSPQSSFGHVMVVFKNKNENLIISDVVHFAALAKKKNIFVYSYKGLTGKFDAFYIREPFFKRKYLYNDLEQRFIYIYWLNYNKQDIKYLIYHLYELQKFRTKYYFISNNCATAIYNLLEVIDSNIPDINERNFLPKLLPIHVIKIVKNKIYDKDVMYPLIVKVKLLVDTMSKKEKKEFFDIITFKKEINDYSNLLPRVKEVLKYYFEYKFRTEHFIYPDYEQIMKLNTQKTNFKKLLLNPLNRTKFAKFFFYFSDKGKIGLGFVPYSISFFDIQNNLLQEKEYEILKGKFFYKKRKFYIESFDIFKTETLAKQFLPYYKPYSWKLYVGFNRKNIKDKLNFDINIGIGKTYNIFSGFLNIMGVLGFDSQNLFNLYIQPEIKYFYYLSDKIKIGYKGLYKISFFYNYWENNLFFTINLKNRYNIILKRKFIKNFNENNISFSIFF